MITINQATTLIADIDPALSKLWASTPFQRHNIVTALHASMSKCCYAHLADRVSVMLRSAIDFDQAKHPH